METQDRKDLLGLLDQLVILDHRGQAALDHRAHRAHRDHKDHKDHQVHRDHKGQAALDHKDHKDQRDLYRATSPPILMVKVIL